MNREQIVKALEECAIVENACPNHCPLVDVPDCIRALVGYALALIRELTEENEKLGIENFDLICALSRIKEETVRKMQERLKEHLEKPEFPWDSFTVAEEVIDQIAREMLDGTDERIDT